MPEIENNDVRAHVYHAAANAYRCAGENDPAGKSYLYAAELYSATETFNRAQCSLYAAIAFEKSGNATSARQEIQAARAIADGAPEADVRHLAVHIELESAGASLRSGDFQECLTALESAHVLVGESGQLAAERVSR